MNYNIVKIYTVSGYADFDEYFQHQCIGILQHFTCKQHAEDLVNKLKVYDFPDSKGKTFMVGQLEIDENYAIEVDGKFFLLAEKDEIEVENEASVY